MINIERHLPSFLPLFLEQSRLLPFQASFPSDSTSPTLSLHRPKLHRPLRVDDDAYPKLLYLGNAAHIFYPYSDMIGVPQGGLQ